MVRNKTLLASLLIFSSMLACQTVLTSSATPEAPSDVYLGLRELWFTSGPEQAGVTADPHSTIPYAVVMDLGFDSGTATITSSIAGDGSMYTSNGGGILGGIGNEGSKNASIHFVQVAAEFVDEMELVTEFPLPSADNARFYLITPSGVFASEELNADLLASGDHDLSPLFLAGNDVITQLRLLEGQ